MSTTVEISGPTADSGRARACIRPVTGQYIAGYFRISNDQDNTEEGVSNQQTWFHEWAAERFPGVPVRTFCDNDITGTTDERGGFQGLQDAVRRGEVTELWTRDQSRLQRDEETWFGFRKLLLGAGIAYFHTRHRGRVPVDDLVTSIQACVDADRVRQDRKNLMDRQKEDALKGYAPNGAIFGYQHAKNAEGKRTLVIVDKQADVIRWAARALLSGRSASSIAKELKRRGQKGARGSVIDASSTVYGIVTNAAVAGLRVYRGEVVADGNWPAILPRDVWRDACAVVDHRRAEAKAQSKRGGTARRRYILSGLARCERCDRTMHGVTESNGSGRKRSMYVCKSCGRTIAMHATDDVVVEALQTKLTDRAQLQSELTAADDVSGRRDGLHAALDAIDARRRKLMERLGRGQIDDDDFDIALTALNDERQTWLAELAKLPTDDADDNPNAAWDAVDAAMVDYRAGDDDQRREAAETIRRVLGDYVGRVVVGPAVKGRPITERVSVDWR